MKYLPLTINTFVCYYEYNLRIIKVFNMKENIVIIAENSKKKKF